MRDKKQKFEYGFYAYCLKECFQTGYNGMPKWMVVNYVIKNG